MENSSKLNLYVKLAIVVALLMVAEGQITSPCSSSAISSFTPCMNYITGSSANGGSPTSDCCDAVKFIMSGSVECACLIINGNVPFSIPFISRPLAISLPRACNSGVQLKCKATGVPVPAPGPIIFGPTPAPAANSPTGQTAAAVAAPSPIEETRATSPAPALAPTEAPTGAVSSNPVANPAGTGPETNPRIRPVVTPNSASNLAYVRPPFLVLTVLGFMALICN